MILFFWTVIKEGTYLYRRLVIKDQSESAGFFLCALVTSDDRDDVIVLGMPQQRGHMLAIFSPLYLSQWNRGELGGFDSTLHLSHAYKHPSPPILPLSRLSLPPSFVPCCPSLQQPHPVPRPSLGVPRSLCLGRKFEEATEEWETGRKRR